MFFRRRLTKLHGHKQYVVPYQEYLALPPTPHRAIAGSLRELVLDCDTAMSAADMHGERAVDLFCESRSVCLNEAFTGGNYLYRAA